MGRVKGVEGVCVCACAYVSDVEIKCCLRYSYYDNCYN